MNPVPFGRPASGSDPGLAAAEQRLAAWHALLDSLTTVLQAPAAEGLESSIRTLADELATLVQSDPDMAQALLVHPDFCASHPYSIEHSAHVAATWAVLARRNGSEPGELTVPLAAALTMNLSMLALQDELTQQDGPLKPAQREQIRQHPTQSAALLRAAGITEPLWLGMVEQHHETPAGADPLPEARRLRMIDVYCACFGARARRHPMLPDQAVRRLYQQHPQEPTALALGHAFGLYPPGTVVRLASLELALVVRRGRAANTPVAVALQSATGEAFATPVQRDTAQPSHAVVAAVTPALLRARIPWAQLFALS
jgi:hypothetical protein